MKHLLLIFSLLFFGKATFAQKQIETRNQTWFGYFNQLRFTDKSGLWIDFHLRLTDRFVNEKAVTITRVGYIYYLSTSVRLTAGYGYTVQYGKDTSPDIPEHRPWQQISWLDKKNGFNLSQYLRIEERFRRKVLDNELMNGYTFNWRVRYNISITLPLKGKEVLPQTPFLFFNDEVHINAGKNIVNNYFDQNRMFAGAGYQFSAHLNAQLGYLFVFQQLPSGQDFVHINAVRLFVYQTLDFRKQE